MTSLIMAVGILVCLASVPSLSTNLNRYDYPTNKALRIAPEQLGHCFAAIARQHQYSYNQSQMLTRAVHFDCPKRYLACHHPPFGPFWSYLSATPTRSIDYYTGHESELARWILQNPDDSIDPPTVFREALTLNGRNIWQAVLTIHEMLRARARYTDKTKYDYSFDPMDVHSLFDKLIDIRGDLAERGAPYYGDHRGSWYRIWAGMLLRMSFQRHLADVIPAEKLMEGLSDREAWADHFMNTELYKEPDHRKGEYNEDGVRMASAMLEDLAPRLGGGWFHRWPTVAKACSRTTYLLPIRPPPSGN